MKKYAVLLPILLVCLIATPVFAYVYYAAFTITESNGTVYTMLPVSANCDNEWMADNGFMNSTANDTQVQTLGGVQRPRMVCDNKTFTAVAVDAYGQVNLYYTTGDTPQETMEIIAGYDGYFTVSDNANIEISDNGSVTANVYLDTSTTANCVSKLDAYRIYTDASGNVTALFYSWLTPSSYVDPAGAWTNEANTFDDNTGTYGYDTLPGIGWSEFIELNTASINCSRVRTWATQHDEIDIDLYYAGAWHNIYEGACAAGVWVETSFTERKEVTAARFRLHNPAGVPAEMRLHEVDFRVTNSTTAAVATVGETKIEGSANVSNWELYIDDVLLNTVSLNGTMIDNANNWVFMRGIPYADNFTMSVAGVLQAWYAPNDMIMTTVLPDRQGNDNSGAFTWGTEPVGITVTFGSLASVSSPSPGETIEEVPDDVLHEVEVSDWFVEPDTGGSLATNPLRPFVVILSDTTSMSEYQAWILLGLAAVLFVTVGTAKIVRGHHIITGVMSGAAIGGMVALTIFPMWALVFAVGAVLAGIVAERTPAL